METLAPLKSTGPELFDFYEKYPYLPSEILSDAVKPGEREAVDEDERFRIVGRYLVISSMGLIDQKGRITSERVLIDIARSKSDEESLVNKIILQRGENMHDEDFQDFTKNEIDHSLESLNLGFDIFEKNSSADSKNSGDEDGVPDDIGEDEVRDVVELEQELLRD